MPAIFIYSGICITIYKKCYREIWGCIIELQVVEENDNMNNRMTVTDADGRGERRMLRKSVSQKQRDG